MVNVGDLGYQVRELPSGAWVQLRIPAALRGEMIQVNLISSYRPSRIAPVGALSTNLQEPFIGNGYHEPLDQWGEISSTNTIKPHNLPLCDLQSSIAEDVIWQSWLPINEKSKYMELQIWYPHKTFDVKESEKGYRFQIELVVEGTHANNDIRLPSSNGSFLAVENLGNRDDAALLPIPL